MSHRILKIIGLSLYSCKSGLHNKFKALDPKMNKSTLQSIVKTKNHKLYFHVKSIRHVKSIILEHIEPCQSQFYIFKINFNLSKIEIKHSRIIWVRHKY